MQINLSNTDIVETTRNSLPDVSQQPVIRLPPVQDFRTREADHRIGNSLQLVSTFLALAERRLEEGSAKRALADARNRIAIVARLHRQLSKTESAEHVMLDDYLGALSDDLSRALIDGRRVTLLVNVDCIAVSATTARDLALIINELISNALKHAFPQDREGIIEIACGLDANGQIALHVRDNGVGYPGHDGGDKDGLGMKMVDMLLAQMKGHLDSETSGGQVIHKICVSRE
jgi:two-component sensor histidine kinase